MRESALLFKVCAKIEKKSYFHYTLDIIFIFLKNVNLILIQYYKVFTRKEKVLFIFI